MTSFINLDNNDYDLNSLFNFQNSFEVLKRVIEALANKNKETEAKLANIENFNMEMLNMRKHMITMSKSAEKRVQRVETANNIQVEDEKNDSLIWEEENVNFNYYVSENTESNRRNTSLNIINTQHNVNNVNSPGSPSNKVVNLETEKRLSRGLNVTFEIENNEAFNKVTKRVAKLEKDVAERTSSYEFLDVKTRMADQLADMENILASSKHKLDDLTTKSSTWVEEIEQLKVKVMDFNIYDLFKANTADGGSSDSATLLIQNLESKINAKLQFMDKKSKLLEEDSFKNKNEITNFKILIDSSNRNLTNLKEEVGNASNLVLTKDRDNKDSINSLEDRIRDNYNKLANTIEENYNRVVDGMREKDENLRQAEENFANEMNKSKGNSLTATDKDPKAFKDLHKRLVELEKSFKVFTTTANIDVVKSDIKTLTEVVDTKASNNEYAHMKDSVTSLSHSLSFVKDTMSQILEDRKIIDDFNWLRKKVEGLASAVLNLKHSDEGTTSAQVKGLVPTETSKFLEQNIFTEFQKGYNRELDGVRRDTDDLKRLIEEILLAMKAKATDRDMKNLEDYLVSKLEEVRVNANKKFAEKVETLKNIKFLDAQVKHISDVYVRKMEKGDNWLIAKKPINGYACASCESYIGDISDKGADFVPWNKYPARDPNDKSYRIGNGFSRMLQMLNVDVKKAEDNAADGSDEDIKHSHSGYAKKDLVLPSVVTNSMAGRERDPHTLNVSGENLPEEEDPYKPKVYRLY